MNFRHIIISASVVAVGLFSVNAIKKGEPKDTVDKRKFIVSITEVKEGGPPKKGVEDEFEFKSGKFFSQFLMDKFDVKWVKYEMTKDSTYTDEDQNENHWSEVELSTTDATDQTIILKCLVDNFDISGEIKVTKKDKLKKKYEFSGKEKPKKK
ncbi:MAG: hypothetical protein K0S53_583 [Bacteroidetes bacterium]|jgi:hypothetical protein|nr:hypothetical protein [Bacteroidota bacterium]MDF2451348.1 hypothetical protein [Bacteroidota bacterium]